MTHQQVTDAIHNEDAGRARKEIEHALRQGKKQQAFNRKNKRRRRK